MLSLPHLATCAFLAFRSDCCSLARARRRSSVHMVLTQIDLPRHGNVRVLDFVPGPFQAAADVAVEVRGPVGVVVRWKDPGS